MEELYINNILIELPIKSISQTFQINDLGELKDRQSNYSNNIKIPKTPKNISTFEMLGLTGNKTRLPYENVTIKYVVDGIELISNGEGVVKNTNNYYNLVIYDGNISMLELFGFEELLSVDFSAYNHSLTIDAFINSFTNVDGYIYGLGKFSEDALINPFSVDTINLSFYTHTLFKMLFTQKGYAITGNIFSDTEYKSRVMSMNIGYEQTTTSTKSAVYSFNHNLDTVINETFGSPTLKEYLLDTHTVAFSGILNITILGDLVLTFGINPLVFIKVNGVPISENEVSSTVDLNKDISVSNGDVVTITIYVQSVSDGGTQTIWFEKNFTTKMSSNILSIPIDISTLIGSTKKIDFIKDMMQRFGLLFRKKRNENTFEFIQIKELLNSKSSAENWSEKFSGFTNESYNSGYAQLNYFKYKYDSSDIEETFGDGEMEVDNINLPLTKTVINSIFKASKLFNGYNILNHWQSDKDSVITPKEDGLRIFKINKKNGSFTYRYNTTISNGITFTGVVPYLDFSLVNYQSEVNKSYLEFQSMLNDYKIINLDCNLSLTDIYNLDFFKLKYFKQLGGYFYLNKVSNFKNNKITKIEIVALGEDVEIYGWMTGVSIGTSTDSGILVIVSYGAMTGISVGTSTDSGVLVLKTITPFSISVENATSLGACGLSTSLTYYHDGTSTQPKVNDTIYTDVGGLNVKVGYNKYYNLSTLENIVINNSGLVTSKNICE